MAPDTARIAPLTHAVDASTVMQLFPSRPRVLALGEPTHGEDTLLDVRNELFRHLVEEEGYRTIAIESDCLMGLVVDDYVTAGTGSLDEAMRHGFSHGFGASVANRELVSWARSSTSVARHPTSSTSPVSTARWRSRAPRAPGRP